MSPASPRRSAFAIVVVRACIALLLVTFGLAARAEDDWHTDELTFTSADAVVLAGTLVTPAKGPTAAVVVLSPGSGPTERYVNLGAIMALRGVAVLTYDKRGVGLSGGSFVDDVSEANLHVLAADAAAAMRWLASDPRTARLPRGFVGVSQSGWVVPLAIADAPTIDFIGFWSGPPCTTSEQLHYQHFSAARGYDRARFTNAEIAEAMKHVSYRSDDVDPLESLRGTSVPVLWLLGDRDPWVPIDLSTRRLRKEIAAGRSHYSFRVFPGEAHNLADSPRQISFVTMVDWISQVARKSGKQRRTSLPTISKER